MSDGMPTLVLAHIHTEDGNWLMGILRWIFQANYSTTDFELHYWSFFFNLHWPSSGRKCVEWGNQNTLESTQVRRKLGLNAEFDLGEDSQPWFWIARARHAAPASW
jgi:hypothetical protein